MNPASQKMLRNNQSIAFSDMLCFGSPLIDIIVLVDDQFLEKYHLKADHAIRAQTYHQKIFQEILSYEHKYLPGGSVTNTARVFQLITKKLNSVCYVGTIGPDEFGDMIRKKLEEEQIYPFLLEHKSEQTGKCAVLVSGNEKHRSLVTDLGASKLFDIQVLNSSSLRKIMKICNILYISTFFLGVTTEAVKQVISTFKKQGHDKKVVINLGASFICETYPDEVKFMFHNADIVIGNEKEFLSFAKISGAYRPEEKLEQNIIITSKLFPINQKTLLVVTRGPDPIITYENGTIQYHEVEPVTHIVDTNGAGDAFVGGFLAKYKEHCKLEDCIKCGKWCASNILQCIGCDFDNKLVYE